MAASVNDKFVKGAKNWVGAIGAGGVSDAVVTTVPLVSTTNLPTDTAVEITIDRVDANGTETPTKMEVVKGVVSSTNIIDCLRGVEGTAQAHSAGAIVEVMLTANQYNTEIDGILVEHGQDGKHKNIASSAEITTGTDNEKIVTAKGIKDAGFVVLAKATGAEINIGTDDAKFVTPKAIADSSLADFIRGDGWITYSAVVPTRASADDPTYVMTFASVDLTSKLSVGTRVKWTQNSTVRYGIITAAAFSTNTTVTIYGGTDYDVEDTATYAISAFYYSPNKAPLGFPLDPTKWTIKVTQTSAVTANPAEGSWLNIGSITISVPIGAWDVGYSSFLISNNGGVTNNDVWTTLSTANNSESDDEFTCSSGHQNASGFFNLWVTHSRNKHLVLSSKTAYYLNWKFDGCGGYNLTNDDIPTIIKAVCSYL